MVPTNHQRIFHYGRELKTLGRTLHALGVGRFTSSSSNKSAPKIVIHLHAIPYSTATSSETNDAKQTAVAIAKNNDQQQTTFTRQRTTRAGTRATTSASIDNVITISSPSTLSTTNQLPRAEVVDLYSDDDNDDIVVVVNKPNTLTSTTRTATSTNNQSNKRRRT